RAARRFHPALEQHRAPPRRQDRLARWRHHPADRALAFQHHVDHLGILPRTLYHGPPAFRVSPEATGPSAAYDSDAVGPRMVAPPGPSDSTQPFARPPCQTAG